MALTDAHIVTTRFSFDTIRRCPERGIQMTARDRCHVRSTATRLNFFQRAQRRLRIRQRQCFTPLSLRSICRVRTPADSMLLVACSSFLRVDSSAFTKLAKLGLDSPQHGPDFR